MRVPTFLAAIPFVLVVVTGCSSETFTEPIITDRAQTIEKARLEILRSFGTDRQVINNVVSEDSSAPDPVAPVINWIAALYGNWLAEYTVEAAEVEVLFVIQEDSTFTSSAALNGSRVTEWDHGIWKFELYNLHLSFQTDDAPDWKTAVFYGTHFNMYDNTFRKVAILPEWATY